MVEPENFEALVDKAMSVVGYQQLRPAITKELLHYDILFALDHHNLLDDLTFQGGTALRLCYNASRLSEDLDFVGGPDFTSKQLAKMKTCLEKYIGSRYGLEVHVKEPKDFLMESTRDSVKVEKWQIKIITAPERPDLPKQMIKLEVANVPAYTRKPLSLQKNYPFLPDGYSDTLIMTETMEEIMADKLVSLVSCQRYVRNRDIWDLRWLKQQGAEVDINYVINKIRDYQVANYAEKLDSFLSRLAEIIHGKAFYDEMSRFIPMPAQIRTLHKEKFLVHLAEEITNLLLIIRNALPK